MIVADADIAFFTALLACLYGLAVVEMWHFYAILFVRSLGTTFHTPAMTASTSPMVPDEYLTRVAGLNQACKAITNSAGPMLGVLLVVALPIQGILAIDVATTFLGMPMLSMITVPYRRSSNPPFHPRCKAGFWL